MTTMTVKFSERVIEKLKNNLDIKELRDPKFPLRFRYHQSREKASWLLLIREKGKTKWIKVGEWPLFKVQHVLTNINRYLDNSNDNALDDQFTSISLLLTWYHARSRTDGSITADRKQTIKWAITKHLIPRIGYLSLTEINHRNLDTFLFWPLQEKLSASTVNNIWRVLRQAFLKAFRLKLIINNSISDFKFADFITTKRVSKNTQLRFKQLPSVYTNLPNASPEAVFLTLLQLMHGTRIGETRKAKWIDICFEANTWTIPKLNTKTRVELTLPISSVAKALILRYREHQLEHHYNGVFMFPDKLHRSCISAQAANNLIHEVSMGNWTSHSLRKLGRTYWLDSGVDFVIGEMLINHKIPEVSSAYFHTEAWRLKIKAIDDYHEALNIDQSRFIEYFPVKTI